MDLSREPSTVHPQPVMQSASPIEENATAVEQAIYELARAAALSGVQYSDLSSLWPRGMPSSSLGRMVVNPISQACLHAQVALVKHLIDLLGEDEGEVRVSRIQARVFAEIERPMALADVTFH